MHAPRSLLLGATLAIAFPVAAAAAMPAQPVVSSLTADRLVKVGDRTAVRGTVAPARGTPVVIERRRPNYRWEVIARVTTDATGRFAAKLPLRRSARLRASTLNRQGQRVFGRQRRNVAIQRRARLSASVAASEAIAGQPISVAGRVWPARPGEGVTIEARQGARALKVGRLKVKVGGRVTGAVKIPGGGTWKLRLVAKGKKGFDRTGRSAPRSLTLHDKNPHRVLRTSTHYIVQHISGGKLYYYENGTLRRVHTVVFGKPGTPTPLGRYRVYSKTVGPGPAFGPLALWYHRGYGIHGTNQEHLLRRQWRYYSLGCTRNTNADIRWLWPRVPIGTPVINIP